MRHTTLISTDTLAANLDRGWAVVDCRYDLKDTEWGRAQYATGHIPSAVYADLFAPHALRVAPPEGRL